MQLYPYLNTEAGFGIGGLELKLLNRLKKMRQGDTSMEVSICSTKTKVPGRKTPKHISINPKRGELNWAPDHIPGETLDSVRVYKNTMEEEMSKAHPNQKLIYSLMVVTYSFRRADINNKMLVKDILVEYPALFEAEHQASEFQRLTQIPLHEVFHLEAEKQGVALFHLFEKKKKKEEEAALLKTWNQDMCYGNVER